MATDNFKYHVIWIDDKYSELNDFITNANMEGIAVKPFKFGKDGLDAFSGNLFYWDGVILDVKCCYEEGDMDRADGYFKIREKLMPLIHKNRPELPVYVYSGQPDIISNPMFEASLAGQKMYVKGSQDEELLSDIVSSAERLPETRIRLKYLQGIPRLGIDRELIEMLKIVEENDVTNTDFFNKARRTLEQIMYYCNEARGLVPEFNGTNISECSRMLGRSEMRQTVPIYVQRSFHSVAEVTNDGSHNGAVCDAVSSGKAPFLIRSTMFELLNILHWCGTLHTENTEQRTRL